MSAEPDKPIQLVSPSNRFKISLHLSGREITRQGRVDLERAFSVDSDWLRFVAGRLGEIYVRLTNK